MKMKGILLALIGLALFVGCASGTTRIAIQSRDWVGMYGQPKFEVGPGDELEVLYSKPCRRDPLEVCWGVRNIRTGETGIVSKRHVMAAHRVYETPRTKD